MLANDVNCNKQEFFLTLFEDDCMMKTNRVSGRS